MMAQQDRLWVNALSAKYCRSTHLLATQSHMGAACIWQGIMQTWDIIQAGFCWEIKSGAH